MQKPLLALFRQLVPKGFHERVLVEETQILTEELAKSNSVVISYGSLTESLAKASDEEEHCRGKQLRLQPRA